ncbi:SCO7613 C-terminal domain-containing membrane protein [Streptomyces sp. CA-251247]|uniref:SCO7613 C-terminal domain-containing membrane protein n=1 Tax=Streptomyces sp. CA-251247 TaxID=3240062 RepID=UPI003D8CFFDF
MDNVPPPAEELAILDRELARLDARRAQLLARRAWLLTLIRPVAAPPQGAWAHGGRRFAAPPAETSPPNVQNLLLTLGGILLTIAAIAFTLVSWGHMGIGGRSAVLGVVTVAALAAPALLVRRGLTSTAESVAALGMVLMVLDAYALHAVALPETDGLGYSAAAAAVLTAAWTAYASVLPRLRTPLPVAAVTAQLPLSLWSLTGSAGAPPIQWALLATAALDVAAAVWVKRDTIRGIALVGASVTGGGALLLGLGQSVTASGPVAALPPAALLTAAAGVAMFTAWRVPAATVAASVVAGLALIAGAGGVVRAAVAAEVEGWGILTYLLCAVALLGVVRSPLPRRLVPGPVYASAAVQGLAVLATLPLLLVTLAGPLSVLPDIWSGAPSDARASLGADVPAEGLTSAPVVLLVVAGVLVLFSRRPDLPAPPAGSAAATAHGRAPDAPLSSARPHPAPGSSAAGPAAGTAPDEVRSGADDKASGADRPASSDRPGMAAGGQDASGAGPWGAWVPGTGNPAAARPSHRDLARGGALALGWAALVVAPPAFGLGYGLAVAVHLAVTLGMLAIAARRSPTTAAIALACGLAGAAGVTALALATRPATFTVLGTLVAALTVAAVVARTGAAIRSVLACAAAVFTTALLGALAGAAELPPHQAALLILVVPAAVALLAARLGTHPVTLPLECTGAAAGVLAIALAAGDRPALALVLALCGVIAAGTALRPERRIAAGATATVLFVLATWVRLAASGVSTPEAYTLPVTIPALAIGVLRRRRDPEASSWPAYGPGLAVTLLPSLVAAWGDQHWLRPLLLGAVALAITLAGARLRLQALLVLGGAVLALDALHELAPYVVQVVGALPRWLPPALAGLLLLAVGATYEQRLRDARRLRESLGRMH